MKKSIYLFLFIISLCLALCGCSSRGQSEPITKQGVYFDTIISVTLYDTSDNAKACLDGCFDIADKCENLFSKSIETSDVTKINSSKGLPVTVSKETIDIIDASMKYSNVSDGKFSIVCGALTSLWNISEENPYIPSGGEIKDALKHVGDDKISYDKESCTVTLLDPEASVDFGAIAKGYIADTMKEYLLTNSINQGIISLGGNILLLGEKPDKSTGQNLTSPFNIGIQKPFSQGDANVITSIKVSNTSVVTSGNYQRCFTKDDKLYHHIIDLTTGYPADSGLNSVTVICPSSVDADMLSTICFLLGEEKGVELIESLKDTGAIFVSEKNEILYNKIP